MCDFRFAKCVSLSNRFALFATFLGLVVLTPIYSTSGVESSGWIQFTLANLPNDPQEKAFWAPVVFAYIFSAYFCYLMFSEYKRFVKKRVNYLISGDQDTPPQTYYTIMLEKIPASLRSEPLLYNFFDNIFPGMF